MQEKFPEREITLVLVSNGSEIARTGNKFNRPDSGLLSGVKPPVVTLEPFAGGAYLKSRHMYTPKFSVPTGVLIVTIDIHDKCRLTTIISFAIKCYGHLVPIVDRVIKNQISILGMPCIS